MKISDAPKPVLFALTILHGDFLIGEETLNKVNKIMEQYPDYFVEELEQRRRWASVPKEVHVAFAEDKSSSRKRVEAANPAPDYYQGDDLLKIMESVFVARDHDYKLTRKIKKAEDAVFKKHYGPYGVTR